MWPGGAIVGDTSRFSWMIAQSCVTLQVAIAFAHFRLSPGIIHESWKSSQGADEL